MPCVAALAATKRELGAKGAVFAVCFQTGTAWLAAFIIYTAAHLIGL